MTNLLGNVQVLAIAGVVLTATMVSLSQAQTA